MKKLLSVFLCVMMVLLMSVTPAAFAQEEELSKDVTINVYSWWDPTKVGMVNLKDGFEKKYADYNVKLNFVKISEYYKTMLTKLAGIRLAGGISEAIDVMMIAFDKPRITPSCSWTHSHPRNTSTACIPLFARGCILTVTCMPPPVT